MNTANNGRHEIQRELQLIVGEGTTTSTNAGAVPWEHRGLLGQTGRRRDAGDHRDTWRKIVEWGRPLNVESRGQGFQSNYFYIYEFVGEDQDAAAAREEEDKE